MSKLSYYWHKFFWRAFPQPCVEKVEYTKDGVTIHESPLSRFDKFLRWRFNRKHHLIKHRWHKWTDPQPRDDAPEISRFECRLCHIYCYMATTATAIKKMGGE